MDSLSRNRHLGLDQMMIACDAELAGTRGCAMNIVRFNAEQMAIECASVGDVNCHLYSLREAHFFAATPLVLGSGFLQKRRVRIERSTVAPGTVVIMFTDGLKTKTSLKGQLDILRQPPIAIAQHLLETYSRPDDDALTLVARL
jgi:hypothetical protein